MTLLEASLERQRAEWRERTRAYRERRRAENPEWKPVRKPDPAYAAKWRAEHPEKVAAYSARYQERNREKIAVREAAYKRTEHARQLQAERRIRDATKRQARKAVEVALHNGQLIRLPCAACGDETAQAHHMLGYEPEHALTVEWLCRLHHEIAHHPETAPARLRARSEARDATA